MKTGRLFFGGYLTSWIREEYQGLVYSSMIYYPFRGLGEKSSPSGEDFSMLAVWSTTANPVIQCMMSNIISYGSRNTASLSWVGRQVIGAESWSGKFAGPRIRKFAGPRMLRSSALMFLLMMTSFSRLQPILEATVGGSSSLGLYVSWIGTKSCGFQE